MSKGSEFRDQIVEALKRDLMGPLVDHDGCYPRAEPRLIDIGRGVDDRKELESLLVAEDGEELLPYAPTSRYGIGILFPEMTPDTVRQLEEDQKLEQDEPWSSENNPPSMEPPEAHDSNQPVNEVEQIPEDPILPRSPRPSAMGFSFVLAGTDQLGLSLRAARYEKLSLRVGTDLRTVWHRIPIQESTYLLELTGPSGRLTEQIIESGPLQFKIGCVVRNAIDGDRIVTCYVRNITRSSPSSDHPAAGCLFQVELQAELAPGTLREYPNALGQRDEEDASLSFLYQSHPVRAVGHGCDAIAEDTSSGHLLRSQVMPVARILATSTETIDLTGQPVAVSMKGLGDWSDTALVGIERIIEGYGDWVSRQQTNAQSLSGAVSQTARRHLEKCDEFLSDIKEGWAMAKSDPEIQQCLRWASHAMAEQQRSYRANTRAVNMVEGKILIEPGTRDLGPEPMWRGFQIAFLLANLAPTVDLNHRRREIVDVIWMPTGGGKTEAYLGLAAFTMLWRRLHDRDKDQINIGDTTVLMRYTLRLLTAQQLQRTASLICALEVIRRDHKSQLGKRRFSVGAWLGTASTPNTHDGSYGAVKTLQNYKDKKRGARPFLLSRCPWCACQFVDDSKQVYGYDVQTLSAGKKRMRARCPDEACPFHVPDGAAGAGLPVYEVDEDIYERPPTFIIGTVDKFAMLAWNERPRSFFGISKAGLRELPGPDLIIQDELHLITGPLGSLVALYESGISILCEHDGGRRPRILAATATTRRYDAQVKQVFAAQSVRLVPPPGLSIDDSYFAHSDQQSPPRVHVGVCTTGLGQFARSQARVFASLAHAVGALSATDPETADYYWTNLAFFGSLRDLGMAKSLLSTDVTAHQWNLVRATGSKSGLSNKSGDQASYRYLRSIELTSASTQSASESLEKLSISNTQKECLDLALATSVIEVGVDVSRLGLLTIVRQPKTAATYIQVSGRVGRKGLQGPGLVIVILNALAGRDISHYERFSAFHSRLYEAVEPATVTPFTDAILERGLRGVVASVIRQTRSTSLGATEGISTEDLVRADAIAGQLASRAAQVTDHLAKARVMSHWGLASDQLEASRQAALAWGNVGERKRQLLTVAGEITRSEDEMPTWQVLTSLRNIDATAGSLASPDWVSPFRSSGQLGLESSREKSDGSREEPEW